MTQTRLKKEDASKNAPETEKEPLAETVCRAISWPVWGACLAERGGWGVPDKDGLRTLRQEAGIAFTDAAKCRNFLMSSLAATDDASTGTAKMSKFAVDTKPIYKLAGERFPSLDCGTLSALLQEVRAKYVSCRFAVWGRNAQALPTYRAPAPLPIRAAEIKVGRDADGYLIRLSLGGGHAEGDRHNRRNFVLRIPHEGRDWAKNKGHLDTLLDGSMKYGAATLFMGSRGDLMVKLAVHLPVRPEASCADRSLLVRTSGEDLLVIDRQEWHGHEIPTFHEDWLRGRIRQHTLWRRRLAEDLKHCGKPRRKTRSMRRALAERCDANNRRINDRLHNVAARLAEHAQRHRVGVVIYCDTDRTFAGDAPFPWATLRGMVRDKLDAVGIPHSGLGKEEGEAGTLPAPEKANEEDLKCPEVTATKRLLRNVARQGRRAATAT